MSVLKRLVNRSINQRSPIFDDFDLFFEKDKSGADIPSFRKTNYEKIISEHGDIMLWSLDSMLKAGINPDIPISTSSSTRFAADAQLENAIAEAIPEIEKIETSKTE